jgi:hypothetical protein
LRLLLLLAYCPAAAALEEGAEEGGGGEMWFFFSKGAPTASSCCAAALFLEAMYRSFFVEPLSENGAVELDDELEDREGATAGGAADDR